LHHASPIEARHFQGQNPTRMLELGVLFVTIAFDVLDRSANGFIALTI